MQTATVRRQTIIAGGGLSQAPGTSPAPQSDQTFSTPPNCRSIGVGVNGDLYSQTIWTYIEDFSFLPAAAAAAGNAIFVKTVGTGTEVIARAAKGGVNIKTQVTTPATNDNVMLTAIASSAQIVPVTAISMPKFKTIVSLTQIADQTAADLQLTAAVPANAGSGYVVGDILTIAGGTLTTGTAATVRVTAVVNGPAPTFTPGSISTLQVVNAGNYSAAPSSPNTVTGGTGTGATLTLTTAAFGGLFASAGMHQTTSVIVPNTAANDEVLFLYDPLQTYSTLAESTAANWILVQNKAGTVTYVDSGVAVVAGADYHLAISFDSSLVPHYFVNGTEYGSGSFAAATSAITLIPCVGEQITAASPTGQIDMDVRVITVERFAG